MRLDKERQNELEPKRIEYAVNRLTDAGVEIVYKDSTKVVFIFKGEKCSIFPYSGWHSGKTIKDGRGIEKLLKQLKNETSP